MEVHGNSKCSQQSIGQTPHYSPNKRICDKIGKMEVEAYPTCKGNEKPTNVLHFMDFSCNCLCTITHSPVETVSLVPTMYARLHELSPMSFRYILLWLPIMHRKIPTVCGFI